MMKTIVEEKPISFKELEQKIFSYVCELGREITTAMLEVLWSSIFVTLVAKKYHESVTLPSGLRMVYDNH